MDNTEGVTGLLPEKTNAGTMPEKVMECLLDYAKETSREDLVSVLDSYEPINISTSHTKTPKNQPSIKNNRTGALNCTPMNPHPVSHVIKRKSVPKIK